MLQTSAAQFHEEDLSEEHERVSREHHGHSNPEISAAMLMTRLGAPPGWNSDSTNHSIDSKISLNRTREYSLDSVVEDREDSSTPRTTAAPVSADHTAVSLVALLRETLLTLDPSGAILHDTPLPSHVTLAYYLSTYFSYHHPFHPFIHAPTFSANNTPRPLLLAILSLGALPSNQELASRLHVSSKMMVNSRIDTDGFSSRSAPLWVTQTVLLNTAFAAWSGDPRGLEFACSVKSFLANLASGLRYELLRRSPKPPITSSVSEDDEWIKFESMRRTYFAVYVFFGQLTSFFNFAPAISSSEPANVSLPCDEQIWNGTTSSMPSTSPMSFRVALDHVVKGQHLICSSYARRILATALYLECWHARSAGLLFVARPDQLDGALGSFVQLVHSDYSSCLSRASDATWRLARLHILGSDLTQIEEVLRYHEVGEIVDSIRSCAVRLRRLPNAAGMLVVAAEIAMDVLFGGPPPSPPYNEQREPNGNSVTASIAGSSNSGGVEDVVVGWEAAVFLMMWVRCIEYDMSVLGAQGIYSRAPDERELDVLQRLRGLQAHDARVSGANAAAAPEDRLSVFVGAWWARHGAAGVAGGWGIRSVLREAINAYADVVRGELVA
ncbi:fungal-specific transcription factor domain-containing protein [Lipomyces oligophaga]|uniref:fungal-specific transcription factor domain-containing protein n=1 Tax=Lipomyces oligophaga TaxID=45792 RepID=UPI0034CDC92B